MALFPLPFIPAAVVLGMTPLYKKRNPPFLPRLCQVESFGLPIMYRVVQWFLGARPIMNACSDDVYSPRMQCSCVPSNGANP